MADANNTVEVLNGFFKESYANKLQNLHADNVKLVNDIKFLPKEKMPGGLYHFPIIAHMEHGISFGAADEDAFNLNAPIAAGTKDASAKGYPMVMRAVLGYTAMSRAAQGGKQAFEDATKYVIGNMLKSFSKKLEIHLLYGQMGYATVASVGGTGNKVITLTTAEWAPGIWAGGEKMPIEIYNGVNKVGEFNIVSVDLDNRTITVDASAAGAVSTDVIYHKGAYGKEFPGIHKILSTTSGTLFGVDIASTSLFKGNQFSASNAALSFNKLSLAASRAVEKGLDGNLKCYVNPRSWANMMNDQAALRKYDGSYSIEKAQNGSRTLKFYSQNGELEIIPSVYIKEGYAYMLAIDTFFRVGSSDISFKRPGFGEQFFRDLENSAALEIRAWTDQAIACNAPGHSVLITNIVNSAT